VDEALFEVVKTLKGGKPMSSGRMGGGTAGLYDLNGAGAGFGFVGEAGLVVGTLFVLLLFELVVVVLVLL